MSKQFVPSYEAKRKLKATPITQSFADLINHEIKEQGTTRNELSKRSGITQPHIKHLLDGCNRHVSLDHFILIAHALFLNPEWLLRATMERAYD
jgi:predicted XRE-type DNA-binding protein